MPSILSHPAVAISLAPFFGRLGVPAWLLLVGAACTVIPDSDVIGFAFGVQYGDVLGHRGLTHSLSFAAVLSGLLVALIPNRTAGSGLWSFAYLFACTASHGVLDALTNGGLGVAFFAPFDNGRHFFAWRPIQVSPIGVRNFGQRGLPVLQSELVWVWLPSFALWLAGSGLNRWRSASR